MKLYKKLILSLLLFSTISYSNECEYELFSISAVEGTTIYEFVNQLSSSCQYSIIINDKVTKRKLKAEMNQINFKNLTIEEVLHLILSENNLSFSLQNSILRISYIQTQTYDIDYIITQRKSTGRTDVTLSSSSAGAAGAAGGAAAGGAAGGSTNSAESGTKIESSDEVIFWEELDDELQQILNRPEDNYDAPTPIINKNSGMITVSATYKQHKRLNSYITKLQKKMKAQVLIDVHMLSVVFTNGSTTGIDWSQIYAMQNLGGSFSIDDIGESITGDNGLTVGVSGSFQLKEVIKFLKEQGEVSAISNPKVLTLNNQPALITVGTEFFYKVQQSTLSQGTSGGVAAQTQNDSIQSVFAGVLLDITPEISEDGTVTLKVNPSLSQTRDDFSGNFDSDGSRTIPPDLDRRQLSSVVTVKDGNRVILGGLISSRNNSKSNKVPLLGDIPGLSYFFKYEEVTQQIEELVIIIEPHIIKKEKNNVSLEDLGYGKIAHTMIEVKNGKSELKTKEKIFNDK